MPYAQRPASVIRGPLSRVVLEPAARAQRLHGAVADRLVEEVEDLVQIARPEGRPLGGDEGLERGGANEELAQASPGECVKERVDGFQRVDAPELFEPIRRLAAGERGDGVPTVRHWRAFLSNAGLRENGVEGVHRGDRREHRTGP